MGFVRYATNIAAITLLLFGITSISALAEDSQVQSRPPAVYYVSTSGNDSNDGLSVAKPLKTISKAVGIAEAGDTVYVRGGVYSEQVTFPNSGRKGNPITLQKYKDEIPVIDGSHVPVVEEGALISISSQSYVKIDGFEIRNYISPDYRCVNGIKVDGGDSTGIEIRNCRVHDIKTTYSDSRNYNAHGIVVNGTVSEPKRSIDRIWLDGNEVYNCKLGYSESIVLKGNVTDFKVTNNNVHDNDNIGICMAGFYGSGNDDIAGIPGAKQDQARHGVCTGNEVRNITGADNPAYSARSADGIYVDGGSDILIERNTVDNSDIGIEAASEHLNCSTRYITIRNNLVTNCRGAGGILIGGAGSSNGTATDIKIYNNTLYDNEPNIGIQNADSNSNQIKNNICYPGTFLAGRVGRNRVSNNITTDPKYKNASQGDFRLQILSPAIDSGAVVNYGNSDLDGNPRVLGSSVDKGCYEQKLTVAQKLQRFGYRLFGKGLH